VETGRMRSGDVDGAVSSGIAAMLTTISSSYQGVTPPPATESGSSPAVTSIFIAVAVMFGLFVLFIALAIVMQIVNGIRYGYLILREGPLRPVATYMLGSPKSVTTASQ
jgi:hypothetical protein